MRRINGLGVSDDLASVVEPNDLRNFWRVRVTVALVNYFIAAVSAFVCFAKVEVTQA